MHRFNRTPPVKNASEAADRHEHDGNLRETEGDGRGRISVQDRVDSAGNEDQCQLRRSRSPPGPRASAVFRIDDQKSPHPSATSTNMHEASGIRTA